MCCGNNKSGITKARLIWAVCLLSVISFLSISGSLILLYGAGDILLMTGTDLINAITLLVGILLIPSNIYIIYCIAHDKELSQNVTIICCPLWLYILWTLGVCLFGVVLCVQKLIICDKIVHHTIKASMSKYRTSPLHRHFIDNVQWSLKCCGLSSYKDWFNEAWYDKIRDYEWEPSSNKRQKKNANSTKDSVPLSCCKTGSCISNYLAELGTYSINTKGCSARLHKILMVSMLIHIGTFTIIIICQLIILTFLMDKDKRKGWGSSKDVWQIMKTNNNFKRSSDSSEGHLQETEESSG